MFTVHLRVNDAATGRPTPVRLRLVAQGQYRPPLGRLSEFAVEPGQDMGGQVLLDGRAHAYMDGTCEVRLPAGSLAVQISKGPEYVPVRREVQLASGQLSLRLTIERWTDWRTQGWYAGDTRVFDLSPHAALLEGAAEGLAVVQLLARERPADGGRPAAVTNLLAFSGSREGLRSDECLVAVNTFNEHPVLGSVSLLNSHRPVFPLRTGTDGEHWSVSDWCDQCHRKSGLVVWSGLPRLSEALAALVLGKIDAYEMSSDHNAGWEELSLYYRLLDAGLRPVLVAGSGKDSNAIALGTVRTYARLGEGQSLEAGTWIEAVRAGRTFVTNGPLLSLEVAGQGPGSIIRVQPGDVVRLCARAHALVSIDNVELLAGGERIGQVDTSGVVEMDFPVSQSTWIAARCHSSQQPDGRCLWAHTSPVWLEVPGRPIRPSTGVLAPLLDILDRTGEWTDAVDISDKQRGHLKEILRQAREVLLARRKDEDRGR